MLQLPSEFGDAILGQLAECAAVFHRRQSSSLRNDGIARELIALVEPAFLLPKQIAAPAVVERLKQLHVDEEKLGVENIRKVFASLCDRPLAGVGFPSGRLYDIAYPVQ